MDHVDAQYDRAVTVDRLGSEHSDEVLLSRSAQGDQSAWEQIVDRYLASMWATAAVSGVDTTTAHSIIEMVWLRLTQRLDAPPALLRPWLLDAVEEATTRFSGRPAADRRAATTKDSRGAFPYPR